jgi:hypothetical protein
VILNDNSGTVAAQARNGIMDAGTRKFTCAAPARAESGNPETIG